MSPDLKAYEGEALRIAQQLESLVRMSRTTTREVERRLGMGSGILSRVFSGRINLKVSVILGVLDVLKVEPAEFFKLAFEDSGSEDSSSAAGLLRLLREVRITRGGAPVPAPAPVVSESELDQRIEETLRRYGLIEGQQPERKARPKTAAAKPRAARRTKTG